MHGICMSLPVLLLVCFRCFALVENMGLEQTTALDRIVSAASRDNHESIMGMGVAGSVHSVLVQCSPKLFEVCTYLQFLFPAAQCCYYML